jgi:hypothetical protein
MTGEQITAALYVLSSLADDCPAPTLASVRDELRFVIARYGTALIEQVTSWLAGQAPAPRLALVPDGALCKTHGHRTDRLAWCQQQGRLLIDAGDG